MPPRGPEIGPSGSKIAPKGPKIALLILSGSGGFGGPGGGFGGPGGAFSPMVGVACGTYRGS